MTEKIHEYTLSDNGIFPNSSFPVLHYINVLDVPLLFPGYRVKNIFSLNGWTNNWKAGIYTYHHYHSVTHEAMGVIKGKTTLLLGGENGIRLEIKKGDVVIIPAGVAHKNMGREDDVTCIGGYPNGRNFDMNYGRPGERPLTDRNIAALPIPVSDPVFGKSVLVLLWRKAY